MANTQTNAPTYQQATIDTAPGAAGYWCVPVSGRSKRLNKMYFSIRETGDSSAFTATVTLQFKSPGDTEWQDYDTYTAEQRQIIEDSSSTQWRIGVKSGNYTSGELTVGIDW